MEINEKLIPKTLLNRIAKNEETIENLQPVVLYNGQSSGNITLSDNVNKFQYIEIFYHNNDIYHGSQKIVAPFTNFFLLSAMPTGDRVYFKPTIYNISGTTISVVAYGESAYGQETPTLWDASSNKNIIDKVIGYKIA